MSTKNEIEKYIFDPNNPRQCKSYNLLLNIAKKEPLSYISPEFFIYFYKNDIFTNDFKSHLWDISDNFDNLSELEKIKLFENQLSKNELREYINNLDIKTEKILKYKFLQEQVAHDTYNSNLTGLQTILTKVNNFNEYIKSNLLEDDINMWTEFENTIDDYDDNYILISKNFFEILNAKILRSSIFITLEENINTFFEFKQKNIKPIFLKKIEDIELLLTVLNKDLKEQSITSSENEEISYIKSIDIKNFYSIKNLSLDNLSDKKEIYILGENGDGKSLFLQALTVGLKGVKEGNVFDLIKSQKEYELKIEDSNSIIYDSKENIYKNLFAYGASRNNNCQMKEDEAGYLTLFHPSWDLKNPMDWLITLDHKEKRGETNIISVEVAKKLLQELLNSDVEIDITPETVTFSEKGSIVNFEQLSAGYKGVITIITDLLVRLSENQPEITNINEFKGIVLIDEVELHLHPKWKYNFVKKLRDIFPLIQFVMTTHSPTVLLGASKEAVFYKIYKEDGEVKISNQMVNEGYTNNSLISSPLFDLGTITSRDYDKTVSSDDYIYDKIHERITEKLKDNINIKEDEILKLIDKELDAL